MFKRRWPRPLLEERNHSARSGVQFYDNAGREIPMEIIEKLMDGTAITIDIAVAEEQIALTEKLAQQVKDLCAIVEDLRGVEASVRHMLLLFATHSNTATEPLFKLAVEDDAMVDLLRHAILDVQARVQGTEPPPFCLNVERKPH